MKYLFTLCALVLLTVIFSCNKTKDLNYKTEPISKETKLSKEFDSLISNYKPGENDLKDDKTAQQAGKKYLNFLNRENSISDYPIFFEIATEDREDTDYSWVRFRTALFNEEIVHTVNYKNYDRIAFEIMSRMKTADAINLKKYKPYFLFGKLSEKGFQGKDHTYLYNPRISPEHYDFGTATYNIATVK